MTLHLGDVPASTTLYIPFATYGGTNGESITLTGLAVTDIEIYKDGSTTQRASDSGYALLDTDGIDFDSITGIHGFSIDLSDNTDAGFFAIGSFYWVVVSSVTVDSQTVNFIAATFRIKPAEASAGVPDVNVTHIADSAVNTSSAQLGVNVVNAAGTAWGSGAITAASIATDAITAAKIAADAIGASELATDAVAEIADAVWDEATADHTTASTFGALKTDTAAILVDTAEIGAAGAGLTAVPWNAAWDAEVESECNDALVALNLDHLLAASVAGTDVVDDSVIAQLVSATATADWDDFDNTTESLQALRDRGDAAWTTGAGGTPPQLLQNTTIATLSTQTSFTLTAGSADDDAYNGAIAIVTDSATSTQKAVGTISDYTGSTKTVTLESDPGIFTMAVGDTIDIIAAISNAPTAVAIRTEIDSNSTQLAAIVADTNELQTDWVDGGRLDLIVDAILVDTAEIGAAGAGLTAVPWNASWDAEVESEVNDGLIALNLDHLAAASVAGTDIVDDSIIAKLVSKSATADWDDFVNTTDSLQAQRDNVGSAVGASISADVASVQTDTTAIVADTNELQTDWADGGRLDLIVDAILVDTGTTLDGKIDTIDTNVDAILVDTGTTIPGVLGTPAGADMSADIAAVKVDTAAVLVDTGTTIPGVLGTPAGADMSADIASVQTDTTAIVADLPGKLTKNTAFTNWMFFMADETDLKTPETGLSVTCQRSIDGAAFAACANSAAEVSNGFYKIDLAASDLNGDIIVLRFTATGAATYTATLVTQPT